MNLCIATPTMHKLVTAGYAKTIAAIGLVCKKHDIAYSMEMVDTAFIVDARNKLVELFLAKPERTHLLMIDSDSELGFEACEKLITCGYPFASLPFPMRQIDLLNLFVMGIQNTEHFMARSRYSFDNALAASLTWCVDLGDKEVSVENGWVKARRTGFGCVLLERGLLEAFPSSWFDRVYEGGTWLSEDMSFCERVKNFARPMLCIDQLTLHNGTFSFGARLIDDQRYFRREPEL
ncbi:MAG: hypothetical protein KGL39_12270 [Patescibacteria group bacterium]|nr:hypothetical protein [Patescibacteria group bacterium]